MASTYSDRLKLEIMATGANANTWGTNTNNNLEVIDAFAAGYLSKSVAGSANITLSTANASDTAESSNKTIELTGALTGDIVVFIPAVESEYNFFNNTTGSQTLTIAATGHTANGIAITQGAKTTVFCDGASNFNVEIISSTDLGSLSGTLPAVSGANLTSLNASNLGSGTVPDARFPATLPAASGVNLTALNATNLGSGTVADARLPTVPTTKGGTGLTSLGSAGTVLTVASPGSALEFATASGFGGYNLSVFNSPGTYSPPASLKSVKVTVQAGGGGGGGGRSTASRAASGGGGGTAIESIPVSSIPGPVTVTVGAAGAAGNGSPSPGSSGNDGGTGGTSSFGSFCSATGGAGGQGGGPSSPRLGGAGGSGSGGDYNVDGNAGMKNDNASSGGGSMFGQGGTAAMDQSPSGGVGTAGKSGSGGSGGQRVNSGTGAVGGAGGAGFVFVEEYLV